VLTPIGEADPNLELELELRFTLRHRAELSRLLQQQQIPNSERYHKWLSASEFTRRFGPERSAIDDVVKWLQSAGFEIESSSANLGTVRFRGAVAQINKAFDVRLMRFGDGDRFGNLEEPAIPARFGDSVATILGLDNFARVEPLVRSVPDLAVPASPLFNGGSQLGEHFAPTDFYTFYDEIPPTQAGIDGGGPANDCIAIFAESNTHPDVIDAFNSMFGLPPTNVSMEFVEQSDPGYQPGAETELLLDLEWSHGVAPGAPLVAYVGDPTAFPYQTTLVDGIGAAVSDNKCGAIDISYHICNVLDSYYSQVLDPIFAQAAAQGQSVFVASGDGGGYDCPLSELNVSEMAADPNVTAIGGTQFAPIFDSNGNDVGTNTEYAWDDPTDATDPGGATGGGASRIFSKPYWQSGPGVPADSARDLPDVAMMAGIFQPGTFIIDDQGGGDFPVLTFVGGTSVGAPIWAGISKLIMQMTGARLGTMNPKIYAMARSGESTEGLRDVISNPPVTDLGRFPAGPGYDMATGWGTVDVDQFVNKFAVEPIPPTPTVTSTPTATIVPTSTPTLTPTATPTSTPTPVDATIQFIPSALAFGQVAVGKSSSPRKVTLINRYSKHSASVTLQAFKTSGDFSVSQPGTTCASTIGQLAPGMQCVVELIFAPMATGRRDGTLMLTDNAIGTPPVVELRGVGK
jgi:subtilase family serine protease